MIQEENDISGILLLNKDLPCTSFHCVRVIKRLLPKNVKVGHTGTLDDFATGLLIICVGRKATRQSNTLMGLDKEYVVRAKLGELTDSLDRTGTILETADASAVTAEQIIAAMDTLCPSYVQVPPIYSALKYEGAPLYRLARYKQLDTEVLDQIVAQKSRRVFIKQIELLSFEPPFFTFKVTVSKGTYVRSLANDIAQSLGLFATTYDLERTKINDFLLSKALLFTDLQEHKRVLEYLVPIELALGLEEQR